MASKSDFGLFDQTSLGPIRLRNRTIRAAAFEGMCPDGIPSPSLEAYHGAVAGGGIGMTTVAYVSVSRGGRSFAHQAWMRPEIVPHLRRLCDRVHDAGARASVQLGHCGNMSDRRVSGEKPIAPSAVFNLFGLSMPRMMTEADIERTIDEFVGAAVMSREAGFDAAEIHAGHGYLVSQFLSPVTNRRKDRWGGSFTGRSRFAVEIIKKVKAAVGPEMAVLVKMNVRDGCSGGMGVEESVALAAALEGAGADGLVLSGGFVSKTPMYVMRGDTPLREFAQGESRLVAKIGLILFGRLVVKSYPFEEAYFFDDAQMIRKAVDLPLILVGGLSSRSSIEMALDSGFDFVALARPLIVQPDFVSLLEKGETDVSPCDHCNKCMGTMYHGEASCHLTTG